MSKTLKEQIPKNHTIIMFRAALVSLGCLYRTPSFYLCPAPSSLTSVYAQ